MTKLILIRHGQTDWNLKRKYCGSTDIGLSAKGRLQAHLLRRRLKHESIDKVYSSNKKRAIQTAKIIFASPKIEKIAGLREMHFGVFEGLTYGEIMKKYPQIYTRWLKNPFSVTIPKAENLAQVRKRVVEAIKKIIACEKDKTVAVVSHGGVISVLLNYILKLHNFWKYLPDSASISVVEYKNKKARLWLFNDTSHLSWFAKSYNSWRNSPRLIKK